MSPAAQATSPGPREAGRHAGQVVLTDINARDAGARTRPAARRRIAGNVSYVLPMPRQLPFPDGHFDCVTIGFGLRNVTDKSAALADMRSVLKPGGQLLVLEFSQPTRAAAQAALRPVFLPRAAAARQARREGRGSYRYLAESIRMHPDQETDDGMMRGCRARATAAITTLSGGIVAVHRGYRL